MLKEGGYRHRVHTLISGDGKEKRSSASVGRDHRYNYNGALRLTGAIAGNIRDSLLGTYVSAQGGGIVACMYSTHGNGLGWQCGDGK